MCYDRLTFFNHDLRPVHCCEYVPLSQSITIFIRGIIAFASQRNAKLLASAALDSEFKTWCPSCLQLQSLCAQPFCPWKESSPPSDSWCQSSRLRFLHSQADYHAEKYDFESSLQDVSTCYQKEFWKQLTQDLTPPIKPRLYPVAKSLLGPRLPPGLSVLGISR